jgi:hypothetical protein
MRLARLLRDRSVGLDWTAPVDPTPMPPTFVRWAGLTMGPTNLQTSSVYVRTIMFSSTMAPSASLPNWASLVSQENWLSFGGTKSTGNIWRFTVIFGSLRRNRTAQCYHRADEIDP